MVEVGWGIVILVLGLLAWLGQAASWLMPELAVRLSLMEAEVDVEPTYWADIRGEVAWDTLTLWMLPLAGLLLIAGEPAWAIFGLMGGAAFVCFAGRGVFTRRAMQRRGFRIGAPQNVRMGYVFLGIWGAAALITCVAAAASVAL